MKRALDYLAVGIVALVILVVLGAFVVDEGLAAIAAIAFVAVFIWAVVRACSFLDRKLG